MAEPYRGSLISPPIIGFPGAVLGKPSEGAPNGTEMYDHILRTMNLAYIKPCIMEGGGGTEIWTAIPSWAGGKAPYVEYMDKGCNVKIETFPKNTDGLTVMFQHMSPMSESYTNSFSQNSVLSGLAQGNEMASDVGMMFGGGEGIMPFLSGLSPELADMAKNMNTKMQGAANKMSPKAGAMYSDISNAAMNWDKKIDFPMMWRGSSFSASYSMQIRLYNPMPDSDDMYQRLIVAPLMCLLAFVCPRSDNGRLWTYPYVMKFTIPGRVHLNAAFCSSMSVVKGGDVNDVAWNSRPNIVDVQMEIQPVHSVKMLSKGTVKGDAPTLRDEVDLVFMSDIDKNLRIAPGGQIGGNIESGNEPVVSNDANISQDGNLNTGRATIPARSAEALANLASFNGTTARSNAVKSADARLQQAQNDVAAAKLALEDAETDEEKTAAAEALALAETEVRISENALANAKAAAAADITS